MTAAFIFGLIAFAAVMANLALRDHRRALGARRRLFDDCLGVLEAEQWSAGGDGFPALEGRAFGHDVKAVLIPETHSVMRRLPQLWLSVTMIKPQPHSPSLSLLARHSGNEFYAVTLDLPRRIEPPAGLPLDVLIRGSGPMAEALCHELAPVLTKLLSDKRVKEVTLTPKGVRIVRQVAEGQRGEHLLLRQAVFGDVTVERTDFMRTLSDVAVLVAQRAAHLNGGRLMRESASTSVCRTAPGCFDAGWRACACGAAATRLRLCNFYTDPAAAISWHTTTPEHSFIGRAALGLFVWAISIPDAYRVARAQYEHSGAWAPGGMLSPGPWSMSTLRKKVFLLVEIWRGSW